MDSCFFTIDQPQLIRATGRDAERYLQARLTCEVKNLPVGETARAAALTAQGKPEGVFIVLRLAEDDFLLIGDGGDNEEVFKAVARYKVADRVELNEISSTHGVLHLCGSCRPSLGALNADLPQRKGEMVLIDECSWAVARKRATDLGVDLIFPLEKINSLVVDLETQGVRCLTPDQQRAVRIAAGVPLFPEEVSPDRVFLEAGVVEAVARNKGCYTGQEVIEKVIARGKVPRCLAFFSGKGVEPLDPGTTLENSQAQTLGKVISSVVSLEGDRVCGFASVKSDLVVRPLDEGKAAGIAVSIKPVSLDFA